MKKLVIILLALLTLLLAGCGTKELKSAVPSWEQRISGDYDELVTFRLSGEETPMLTGVDILTGRMTAVVRVSEGDAAAEWVFDPVTPNRKKLTAGALALSYRHLSEGEIDMLRNYWNTVGEARVAVWEENPMSDCAVSCVVPSPSGGWLEIAADAPGLTRTDLLRVLLGLSVEIGEAWHFPTPAVWYSVLPWEETWDAVEYESNRAAIGTRRMTDGEAAKAALLRLLEGEEWFRKSAEGDVWFGRVTVSLAGAEAPMTVLRTIEDAGWMNGQMAVDRFDLEEKLDAWSREGQA